MVPHISSSWIQDGKGGRMRGMWGLPLRKLWVIFCRLSLAGDMLPTPTPLTMSSSSLDLYSTNQGLKAKNSDGRLFTFFLLTGVFPVYFPNCCSAATQCLLAKAHQAVGSDSGSGLKWPAGHWGKKQGTRRASLCVSHGQC